MGTRTLGKDIQNQTSTIEHPALNLALYVTFLTWRQCMVKNHQADIMHTHSLGDFFDLALTDKGFHVRNIALGRHQIYRIRPRRNDEFAELIQILPVRSFREVDVY